MLKFLFHLSICIKLIEILKINDIENEDKGLFFCFVEILPDVGEI